MRRSVLSAILALSMVLSLLPAGTLMAAAAGDVIEISDAAGLASFRDRVNSGETGLNAALRADIDLNHQNWTPIGNNTQPFAGVFDGGGHKITGLYLNAPGSDYQGLFGCIDAGSTVKNVGVDGAVTGQFNAGGVAGENRGTIENCYHTGVISGGDSRIGGIAGQNFGLISGCYNTGDISSTGRHIAGIAGQNGLNEDRIGTIENCYNTGTIKGTGGGTYDSAGGITGENWATVQNCYNTGEVSHANGIYVGSIAGLNRNKMINCYYLRGTGLGAGHDDGATRDATSKTETELKDLVSELGDGWTTGPFSDYPILADNPEGGDGSEVYPYEIDTLEKLEIFRDLVNNGSASICGKLTADIDVSPKYYDGGASWTPIGNNTNPGQVLFQGTPFTGVFDGGGHIITGLYINSSSDYVGLFGYVDGGGEVKDLGIVDGIVHGTFRVGGVAGVADNRTRITNCYCTGEISGTAETSISHGQVGGVVGQSSGEMENCYCTGGVFGGVNCQAGGVVGGNYGTLTNCYNTGEISGGDSNTGGIVGSNGSSAKIQNCYNTGAVTGSGHAGGVAGWNDGAVENCYNTGAVEGGSWVGGIAGYSASNQNAVTNCYYLKTDNINSGLDAIGLEGDRATNAEGKAAGAFTSGEVAWLLQNPEKVNVSFAAQSGQIWGQTVGAGSPELTGDSSKKVYQIALDYNYEGAPGAETAYVNADLKTIRTPDREGYRFSGWYREADCATPAGGPVTEGMTLYAKWTAVYTITVGKAENGSVTADKVTAAEGETVTLTAAPVTGYRLKILTVTDGAGTPVSVTNNTFIMPAAHVTVTAEFELVPEESVAPAPAAPGGGSSGESDSSGDSGAPTYPPTVSEPDNGRVSVSPGDPSRGDTVTVTPEPDEGYEVGDVTVKDSRGSELEVKDNGDGTFSFTQPSGKVTIEVTFVPQGTRADSPSAAFSDLDPNAWYREAVDYVLRGGLMSGYGDGTFGPNDTLSRAMLAQILYNLGGGVPVNYLTRYEDVPAAAWYAEAVRWAAGAGIVSGYGDGRFGPEDPITREQLAAMIYRYEQSRGGGFAVDWTFQPDYADMTAISDYAREAAVWCSVNGILSGYDDGALRPQGQATRGEAASMLMRFLSR